MNGSPQLAYSVSPSKSNGSGVKVVTKKATYLPRNHKFRNPDLEAATDAIQAEFNALLNDRGSVRPASPTKDLRMDDFYTIMGDFY